MKFNFKNIFIITLLALISIFSFGCKKDNVDDNNDDPNINDDGNNENNNQETPSQYNSENYFTEKFYSFSVQKNVDEAKEILSEAINYFSEIKSYSYKQTLEGVYDYNHEYTGTTKIDVTGEQPKASMKLSGDLDFEFYVSEGKAYVNYNDEKVCYAVENDLSDLVSKTEEVIGEFTSFNPEDINEETLDCAGIDEFGVTVIQYFTGENEVATIVIDGGKIMKVLYYNLDSMTYVAEYDYNPVTITLPSDLDTYVEK